MDDLVSAIDGNWPEEVKSFESELKSSKIHSILMKVVAPRSNATLDSIKAVSIIR